MCEGVCGGVCGGVCSDNACVPVAVRAAGGVLSLRVDECNASHSGGTGIRGREFTTTRRRRFETGPYLPPLLCSSSLDSIGITVAISTHSFVIVIVLGIIVTIIIISIIVVGVIVFVVQQSRGGGVYSCVSFRRRERIEAP